MKRVNLLLFLTILISIYSCKSIEYIPVETGRTEYINTHTTDTIIQNSTTVIKEKGDTIYIFKEKEVYKYRDRVEYVEVNKIKDWQSFLMILGGGFILLLIYKLYNKFKK